MVEYKAKETPKKDVAGTDVLMAGLRGPVALEPPGRSLFSKSRNCFNKHI